ncbi:9398_t:CDS:2, partial [Rhizophagus irregularis]
SLYQNGESKEIQRQKIYRNVASKETKERLEKGKGRKRERAKKKEDEKERDMGKKERKGREKIEKGERGKMKERKGKEKEKGKFTKKSLSFNDGKDNEITKDNNVNDYDEIIERLDTIERYVVDADF